MNIDIHTLAIIMSITILMQAIVLSVQMRIDRTFKGPGWWTIGSIFGVFAFAFNYLRDATGLRQFATVANNILFLATFTFYYVGILRFFGKKENSRLLLIVSFLFSFITFHFTYLNDNLIARRVTVSIAIVVLSLLSTHALIHYRIRALRGSTNFLAFVFIVNGLFFLMRTLVTIISPSAGSPFAATLTQSSMYLVALITSNLWTYGFIILLSKRLNLENQESRENMELIFQTNPDSVSVFHRINGTLIEVNQAFLELTGYTREEVIGRTVQEIELWNNPADLERVYTQLAESGFCKDLEAIFKRKDGTEFMGISSIASFSLKHIPHFICVTRDITDRKQAEEKIKSLLVEKEIILKEVHHRIKNNMNTICSLLLLQSQSITNATAITALEEAANRVNSMALLYDKLYKSSDYREVSVKDYLTVLIDEILENFPNSSSIKVEKRIENFELNTKRLQPLAIIVNELITNIMKYAFKGRESGLITVTAKLLANNPYISIEDNGNGLPESISFSNSTGFGLMLVRGLTEQLNGKIKIDRENGTKIILEFPK
ncbi:MAG TPA: histidine kinase dimerization/phosphoacceptor domain -containing protein [Leptospiraceae bacterium]|nr:histidine kinase dimerization/phosphoacceptor domain -containing protein [Leptospiraceae bacterium]HRG73865.1 histidine kinase dimerization/phosphoacceptor domain -containing protein [Leptospiraceae bacterium]